MNANKTIILLEYLEQSGVGEKQDVAKILLPFYPLENHTDHGVLQEQMPKLTLFLSVLQEFEMITYQSFEFTVGSRSNYPEYPQSFYWLDNAPLYAAITPKGLDYVQSFRQQEQAKQLNESVIATNATMVNNETAQTNIIRKQTNIFWFTLILTAASAAFSGINLIRDDSKRLLQQQVHQLEKEKQLQRTPQPLKVIAPSPVKAAKSVSGVAN